MSSKPQKPRKIYWDSCIFFVWIKDEPQDESVKNGIEQTIELAYQGNVIIVTSAVTLIEVLQSKMTSEQKQKFREIFHHRSLQLVDLERRIAEKAAVIREAYDSRTYDKKGNCIGGSFMSLGDSIHIATALHLGVNEMHTLDGSGKRMRRLDLLKLNGNVAGMRLAILRPHYVPPPQALSGPVPTISGPQMTLLELAQEQTIPSSGPVPQGAAAGSPQNEAGIEAAKESTASNGEAKSTVVSEEEVATKSKSPVSNKPAAD
jgi:hypothetical protein